MDRVIPTPLPSTKPSTGKDHYNVLPDDLNKQPSSVTLKEETDSSIGN